MQFLTASSENIVVFFVFSYRFGMNSRSKSAERTAMRFRRPSEQIYGSSQGSTLGAPTKPTRSVSIANPPTDLDRLNLPQGPGGGEGWHHVYKEYDHADGSGHMYRY